MCLKVCIWPEPIHFYHHKLVTRYQTIEFKQHEYQSKPGPGTQGRGEKDVLVPLFPQVQWEQPTPLLCNKHLPERW